MHPNLTYFAETERVRPGATTMTSERWVAQPLENDRLAAALDSVVQRHSVLRCAVVPARPLVVEDPMSWWTSWRLQPKAGVRARLEVRSALSPARTLSPVPLGEPPTVRLQVAPDGMGQRLRLVTSHAVFDGVSQAIFWRDLDRALAGRAPTQAQSGYLEHAAAEQAAWGAGAWRDDAGYWRSVLADEEPEPFPYAERRRSIWPVIAEEVLELSPAEATSVREAARGSQTTPFVVLTPVLAMATKTSWGWRRPTFVLPIANRSSGVAWDAIGLYANLVPVLIPIEGSRTTVLRATRAAVLDALGHGRYPLFLLRAVAPELAGAIDSGLRFGVRQADPGLAATRGPSLLVADSVVVPPAVDYGLGFEVLADVFLSPTSIRLRLAFRPDRLHRDGFLDLVNACREELRRFAR